MDEELQTLNRGALLELVMDRRKSLELVMRRAASAGLTQRDMANVLELPMNTVGSLNRQWDLDLLR
jgi:hypothetical protein